jgi:hypothetical protein
MSYVTVQLNLHRQLVSLHDFEPEGRRTTYTPEWVGIEAEDGRVVAELSDPGAALADHILHTPWDPLHLVYLSGYALWNCFTTPFSLLLPGYRTGELEPWREAGETWRRLQVKFPSYITTHSTDQVFYFDSDGLLRRHDYTAAILGGAPVVQYAENHLECDGIIVPTRHRVYPTWPDGSVAEEKLLISVDLSDVTFS